MAISLEKFIQQLQESGVVAPDTLQEFLPPRGFPASAEELARKLVRHEKVTKFQVEEICRGKGKSLVLGNYVVMEKIGAGGMGQVFKARHRVMERLVAVKVLPSAMTNDQLALARFHREVKAAAKLAHPHIVTAYDADQAGGVHFLVMEMVEGSDLSALVKKNGPFPVDQAIRYILQAAKGLEFAHKKGVVHRDIKPANLLLDRDGTVKILDMGLARLHEDTPQAELTSTGTVMGTVDYMAPEQAVDTKSADARADIYALGCSLHYLLSGKSTYDGDTLMAKLLAHRDKPIPRLRDCCPLVPDEVESIFRKMVAKNASDRYQTMTELISELELCVTDRSTPRADHGISRSASEIRSLLLSSPNTSADETIQSAPTRRAIRPPAGNTRKLTRMGAGVLGVAVLAASVFWFKSRDSKPVAQDTQLKSTAPAEHEAVAAPTEKPLAFQTPEFDRWVKAAAALPAEKQVEAVSAKLKELNPEFDGKLSSPFDESSPPLIQDGIVVEIMMIPDKVTDLSPIRAFSELRLLQCWSRHDVHQPLDVSVLNGMKIRKLVCFGLHLDFAVVKGLPLEDLVCIGGGFTDLAGLSGMPLKELGISGNWEIKSLEPLQGMSLTSVSCDNTQVADLSPLRGMALKKLSCYATSVTDLSPLQGMPLEELYCDQTRVTDLLPLVDMRLKTVSVTPSSDLKGLRVIRRMDSLTQIGTAYNKLIPRNDFWKQYDAGAFDSPVDLKRATDVNSPEFQKWMKDVQALRAEEQIEAVRKKLIELNPGFDGKLTDRWYANTPEIGNGSVTTITFFTDAVKDIAPVRALGALDFLGCQGSSAERGKLRDLSPLKGMRITRFDCGNNLRLSDLSPLTDSRLAHLGCAETGVTDLSVLRGMALEELVIGSTDVSDLAPLQGMPLKTLGIWGSMVSDLSPLTGMKLRTLGLSGAQHVTSLAPLQGMPLVELVFNHAPVSDLSPVKGMPLETLILTASDVTDLSPLEGMSLNHFSFTPQRITKGIDVVRRMKSLKTIGTGGGGELSPDEFWKKYDAGEFGKP
jgi:serine/threonine protein kinase/Leucine-rich repeat (LRR) protein